MSSSRARFLDFQVHSCLLSSEVWHGKMELTITKQSVHMHFMHGISELFFSFFDVFSFHFNKLARVKFISLYFISPKHNFVSTETVSLFIELL